MAAAEPFLNADDMAFLREMTAAVMDASRVAPEEKVGNIGPNVTGGTVIRPGGRACYPAFWIRDYAMSIDSGLVTPEEQRHMLFLTARHQQDERWHLPSGSIVPAGSIADHISFGDKPIFYPGTLEDYEGQGGERWGILPSLDDHYFFVHMAARYVEDTGNTDILSQDIRGKSLLQRLEEAYAMPPSRPDTNLVYAELENRGVTFGFVDTITHTGDLLFCSVLKFQAARQLAALFTKTGDAEKSKDYADRAQTLKQAIDATFPAVDGLLRASTGFSAQPDVWGTAYAVYVSALTPEKEQAACKALAQAYEEGTLAWRGNVRHVRTTDDFSDTTMWERAIPKKNTYQNGAYWGTPVGWVAYAIAKVDRTLAARLASEYIAELREGDFRRGPDFGSPWECMHPDGNHRQNPVYLTSVTCPLAGFLRIEAEIAAR
jgi:hypothetical protein